MGKPTLVNGAKYRNAPRSLVEYVLNAEHEVTEQGCHLWPGPLEHGYGIVSYTTDGRAFKLAVHRLAYLNLVGDPGDDVPLDHMCHERLTCNVDQYECPHRRCFNVAHLEPSTIGTNAVRGNTPSGANAAKTECDYGHEFTPANTYLYRGQRRCRACNRRRRAEFLARKKAGRTCERCGTDISQRKGRARYCEACNLPTWRGSAARTAAKRAAGRACAQCGTDITDRHGQAMYCETCHPVPDKAAREARRVRNCPDCGVDISDRPLNCERCESCQQARRRQRGALAARRYKRKRQASS